MGMKTEIIVGRANEKPRVDSLKWKKPLRESKDRKFLAPGIPTIVVLTCQEL